MSCRKIGKVHPITIVITTRFEDISTGYRKGYTTRQNRSPVMVQTFPTEAQTKKLHKVKKIGEHCTPNPHTKDPGIVVTAVSKSENERDKMKLLQVVWSLRRVAIKKITKLLPKKATTPIVPIMNQNQISVGTSFSSSPIEVLVTLTGKVWLFPSMLIIRIRLRRNQSLKRWCSQTEEYFSEENKFFWPIVP